MPILVVILLESVPFLVAGPPVPVAVVARPFGGLGTVLVDSRGFGNGSGSRVDTLPVRDATPLPLVGALAPGVGIPVVPAAIVFLVVAVSTPVVPFVVPRQ